MRRQLFLGTSSGAKPPCFLSGQFGRLVHGSLTDPSSSMATQKICGKTLHGTATPSQLNEMLHDCCLFATLKHPTINSPLGIVHKADLFPYPLIIYPYSQRGILKRFLIHNRTSAREQVRAAHCCRVFIHCFSRCCPRKSSFTWRFTLPKAYISYIDEKCS